jgi:hypothetical protein
MAYAMYNHRMGEPPKYAEIGAAVALILTVYATIDAFNTTVTLTEDAIEVQTFFRLKRLPYSGILGRREWVLRNADGADTHYLKLEPNDYHLPVLNLMKSYNFDEEFYRWFRSLRDLDALYPDDKGGLLRWLFGQWW